MKFEVGQLVIGRVESVKPYALFLSFNEETKGLLHISEISDSYIRDIEKFGTVGDEIKVKILSIDEHNGFMRVSLKQVPEEERFTTHSNERRHIPEIDKEAFKDLEDHLDGWIKDTLEKAKGEK
jgi:predicted RNA-binding protein with RPS1 domain